MTDSTISSKMWAQFTQSLLDSMGAGGSDGKFQVLTNAVALPSAGVSDDALTTDLDIFLNIIPTWGSDYAASNRNVIQAYQVVLNQIEPAPDANAELKERYQIAIAQATSAATEYNQFMYNTDPSVQPLGLMSQFMNTKLSLTHAGVPSAAQPTYEQFIMPFKSALLAMGHQTVELGTLADDIVKAEASGPWLQARGALNAWMKANPEKPATYAFPTDPWLTLNGWINGQGKAEKSVQIDQSSVEYDYHHSEWTTHSSHSTFFGLSSSSSTEHHASTEIMDDRSHYSLKIDYEAQALLLASPDRGWFNGSVLRDYVNGPWREGTQYAGGHAQPYGPEGDFPLMVTGMYVVMNPTITIEMDTHTYTKLKTKVSQSHGGGLNVGPFYSNSSGSSSSDTNSKEHWDDASNTVVITDQSNVPKIIAVSDEIMP